MTQEEKKILEGYLSKTLTIDTEELAGLYNDAGELVDLSIAEKADAERHKKLKDNANDQYKRGVKEGASKLEKALRDKYDTDSDLTGVDLFDFILSEKLGEAKKDTEDITLHPEFIRQQREWEKALKAKEKEVAEQLEAKEKEFSQRIVMSKVERAALERLDALRPVLPSDAAKAKRWRDKFVDEFKSYEYQEVDGEFVILKKGERLTDAHGKPVTFDKFTNDTAASMFDFYAADDRSSSGNQSSQRSSARVPKDKDEFVQMMREAKTPEERVEITKSYENSRK